jgi:zinc transport system permease protein
MLEALQLGFFQNAIAAGLMVSVTCGIVGTLVVVNRLVFLSGGMAHAAYGGIGLAFFLGLPYMVGTLGFTIAAAVIVAAITLKTQHRSDTVIGVLWAVGMALGVILVDLTPGYHVDLMSYLFGSILTVSQAELLQMAAIGILILALVGYFYQEFLALSYDQEFARLRGVPVTALYILLLCMVALSIVMIIRVVGLILVMALLTIPPSIAEKYAGSLWVMMLVSVLLSSLFILTGLWLSYSLNLTSGATIIMVSAAGYLISGALDRFVLKPRSGRNRETVFQQPDKQ